MDALNLPRPAWMTEDLILLEEQVRRFMAAEFAPHLERWSDAGMYERAVWTKAGEAGLLCAGSRRNTAAPAARSRTRP
jgi:acyl-CoA dehydrogenase